VNNKNIPIKSLFALLVLIFYFLGYYIREISNGAGNGDLEHHIWKVIKDLEKDYYLTLKNYLDYGEATFPFFHSIQALFNPFIKTNIEYTFSNTLFNLLIITVFFYYLKKKEIFTSKQNIILVSFLILISPWFRSSSYWGMTENMAFFFVIPSLYYLNKMMQANHFKNDFLLIFFLSLTIYTRQQYVFLVLFHLIYIFMNYEFKRIIKNLSLYFILSLPGLYTYQLWGVFGNISNATSASHYISIDFIYKNIIKISTILFFYTIPVMIINLKKSLKLILNKKFFYVFIILTIIELILFKDISFQLKGGGYVVKFNRFFLDNSIYSLIFLSSFYFSILYFLLRKNINYIIILIFLFIVFGLSDDLYQEWFDPLYIFILYIFLPSKHIKLLNLNKTSSIYLLYIWEFLVLSVAIIYYHYYLEFPFFYYF